MANMLNFVPRLDRPNITYKIKHGDNISIRMPNHDKLPIRSIQVKVPAFYSCKVLLDYLTKPKNFQFVLDKDNHVYSIDFKTNTFNNHILMLRFDFSPSGTKNNAFSSEFLNLSLFLDFRSDKN